MGSDHDSPESKKRMQKKEKKEDVSSSSEEESSSFDEVEANERTKKVETGSIRSIIKIGVVGDGTVGKTTLLLSYIARAFLTDYTPTVFDNFSAIEEIDGHKVNVILWDTAGQDDYKAIRTTCYTRVNYDIFLLCFSVVHKDSFDNVRHKWLEELKQQAPNTPYVLMGTKIDLREKAQEDGEDFISFAEGQKRAKEIKAKSYLESTATDPESVTKAIVDAIHILTDPQKKEREKNVKKWAKQAKKEEKEEQKRMAQYKKMQEKQAKENEQKGEPKDEKKEDKKEDKPEEKKTPKEAEPPKESSDEDLKGSGKKEKKAKKDDDKAEDKPSKKEKSKKKESD